MVALEYLGVVLFICIFIALSAGMVWYISRDWRQVAGLYPLQNDLPSERWYLRSGEIAGVRIGGFLIVGADLRGVCFAACFPFSFFLPTLFVPWTDLSGVERKGLLVRIVELRFSKAHKHENIISGRIADKLERCSGELWKYKRAQRRFVFERDHNSSA
jgi:hypothetical protein